MAQEVELKLALPATEQNRFLRSPLLREAIQRGSDHLLNIYYDTPELALYRHGIALRLRRNQYQWLQTVKCAGTSNAGLSARPEWEDGYGGHFDFTTVDDDATRKRLDRLKPRLGPVFETDFRRITWKIREGKTELCVALDRGSIVTAGKVIPISEVEIELAQGEIADIFALAERLAQQFALTPCLKSKAENGYRLFLGAPERPVRAAIVALDATMAPWQAFRAIAQSCLNHLQQNHHGALQGDDAEYIHQMRVALRRLRAALRLFRTALPAGLEEQLLPPLHRLMSLLGAARDLDVLTIEIVAPVVAALPEEPRIAALANRVAERRHGARQQAAAQLGAPDYGRLLLFALSRLACLMPEDGSATVPLGEFAAARLKRMRRKLLRLARAARHDDPTSLHALRIATKRMRYALDFFAPLLPARRTTALLDHLARLQDKLGQLNDLANAGALLMECANDDPGLREAVSLIGGWHGTRYTKLLADVPRDVSRLRKLRLPKGR